MGIFNFLKTYSDSITALSAVVVTGLAVYGVREWKRQLKGKTDYEIARRYLKATLQMRDAIKFVRNPFVSVGEMRSALKEHGFNSEEYENKDKTNRAVYSIRWKKVQEAWTNLEAELLEAEVSWGYEAINTQKSLNSLVKELFAALEIFLSGFSKFGDENHKLIYDFGDQDEFLPKVNNAIKEIKDFLKPHLE
ncbi:MAG: hypothetical protein ABIB72_00180 [Candidatus Falkowbacteria bacterium]